MMKFKLNKVLALVLATIMMFSSLAVYTTAAGTIKFALSDITGACGDTIDVVISVSGDTEVNFIALYNLTYSADDLEYVGFKSWGELAGEALSLDSAYDEKTKGITLGYEKNIIADGDIATLQFKIKDDCNVKETQISIDAAATLNRKPVDNGMQTAACAITVVAAPCPHTPSTDWKHDDTSHWHECTKCGEKSDEASHTWDSGKETKKATCTAEGEKTYTCTICSATKTEAIKKLDHKFGDWEKADDENHKRTCTYGCGETETEAHKWDNGKATKEATCTSEGEKTYTCSVCNATKTEAIAKLDHSFSSEWKYDETNHWHECECGEKSDLANHTLNEVVDIEPTEEAEGEKHYECECGYKSEAVTIPPLDHTHKLIYVEAVDSTCVEEGNVEYWHCEKCGLNYADEKAEEELVSVVTPLKDHTLGDVAEVPADHVNSGVKAHKKCSVCEKLFDNEGNETTEEALIIAPLGHNFSDDYNSDENGHWRECDCGEKSEKYEHTYEWTTTTDADCENNGLETGKCSVCGYETTREINAIGHDTSFFQEVLATCTDTGNVAYWHCNNCHKNFEDEECTKEITDVETPIDPSNHVGDTEIRDAKAATCCEEGYTGDTYCKSCGKKIADGSKVAVDLTNHIGETEVKNVKTATCCEKGYTGDTYCTSCNTVVANGEVIPVDLTNHVGETEVRNEKTATCCEEGYTGDTYCKSCNTIVANGEAIAVDPDNHIGETEVRNAKTATCSEEGYTGDTCCTGCDAVLSEGETIPVDPTNHVGETEIRDAKAATCCTEGYTGDTYCKSCGTKIADGYATAIDGNMHSFVGGVCQYCGMAEPTTQYYVSYGYCNDYIHYVYVNGVYSYTAEHVPTSFIANSDGEYTWHVCAYCGGVYGKIKIEDDNTDNIVIEEPVEAGIAEIETMTAEKAPTIALTIAVFAILVMTVAFAPVTFKKKEN